MNEDDVNAGYQINDRVRCDKRNFDGVIREFEWSGVRRAVIEVDGRKNEGYAVVALSDLKLISRIDGEPNVKKEVAVTKIYKAKRK